MKRTTFKILRISTKKSVNDVISVLGIKEDTYRKYEQFTRLPSSSVLANMSEAYECSNDEVMEAYKYQRAVYELKRTL